MNLRAIHRLQLAFSIYMAALGVLAIVAAQRGVWSYAVGCGLAVGCALLIAIAAPWERSPRSPR